jgi:hypothetical protein
MPRLIMLPLLCLGLLGCSALDLASLINDPDMLVQEGKMNIERVQGEKANTVFYAIPYLAPPNLTIEPGGENVIVLKEQRKDGFVFAVHHGDEKQPFLKWKAVGRMDPWKEPSDDPATSEHLSSGATQPMEKLSSSQVPRP